MILGPPQPMPGTNAQQGGPVSAGGIYIIKSDVSLL